MDVEHGRKTKIVFQAGWLEKLARGALPPPMMFLASARLQRSADAILGNALVDGRIRAGRPIRGGERRAALRPCWRLWHAAPSPQACALRRRPTRPQQI